MCRTLGENQGQGLENKCSYRGKREIREETRRSNASTHQEQMTLGPPVGLTVSQGRFSSLSGILPTSAHHSSLVSDQVFPCVKNVDELHLTQAAPNPLRQPFMSREVQCSNTLR